MARAVRSCSLQPRGDPSQHRAPWEGPGCETGLYLNFLPTFRSHRVFAWALFGLDWRPLAES